MKHYGTEQENFWAGEFGDEYIARNDSDSLLASKTAFFAQCLRKVNLKSTIQNNGGGGYWNSALISA